MEGHSVKRINHIGDWGTQFGMLVRYLETEFPGYLKEMPNITDLQEFYQKAKRKFDSDETFREEARKAVVNLQNGEEKEIKAWEMV
jgi:arginyl-tRNA synthetase